MGKPTLNRVIIDGEELQKGVRHAVGLIKKIALSAYGPASHNVMIEHRATPPTISHDGVTNIDSLEVAPPVEDMVIKIIKQAAERTNATAGDGTTLSTLLACCLYEHAKECVEAGEKPMAVSKRIIADCNRIIEAIDAVAVPIDGQEALTRGVCRIAAGEDALGDLIYSVIQSVGRYGGVNVNYSGALGIHTEFTDGLTINRGLVDHKLINDIDGNRSVYTNVPVVILANTVSQQEEIIAIVKNIQTYDFDKAIFFGDITGDALKVLEMNRRFDATVVSPDPLHANYDLTDVAKYTGGTVFYGSAENFDCAKYLGTATNAVITGTSMVLNNPHANDFDGTEIDNTIDEIKRRLQTAEVQDKAFLECRLARLTGKVANIFVGGASDVERKEIKLRVDDAICAAKSALEGGVVAGGGVCLRDISKTLSLPYLAEPYRFLTETIAPRAGELATGVGVNVITGGCVDMLKAGIVDPALVIKEAVINSHSVVAKLITTDTALVFEERTWNF